jgi:hypothetical protein
LSEEIIKKYIFESNQRAEINELSVDQNEVDTHFRKFLKTELLSNTMKPLIQKRIYNEELSKALYLNYINPEKYNLKFFSEYFEIEPKKMKELFDSVSYPLINRANFSVVRIYRFIYV